MPPNALKTEPISETDYLRGSTSKIEETEVLSSGDWTAYLPISEPQKYQFDTNECSQLSGINSIATQMDFLYPTLTQEAKDWFSNNGYLDGDNKFSFSERFTGILSGTSISGNSQWAFWKAVSQYGLLPRKDLGYSMSQSQQFKSQESMCLDYYRPSSITDDMKKKAIGIFQWISISYEYVWYNLSTPCPIKELEDSLKQAPIQIGTPVCPGWNSINVPVCDSKQIAHSTVARNVKDGNIGILDHYMPYLKTLGVGYPVYIAVKGVVTIKPTVSNATVTISVVSSFLKILVSIGIISQEMADSLSLLLTKK